MTNILDPMVFSSIPGVNTPHRILLVDDNDSDARVLGKTIKRAVGPEADLVHAVCLADAFEQLNKEPFDVILLSLLLPDCEAMDAVRRLREYALVPIIVMTTCANDCLAVQALEAGADDYLVKQGLNCEKLRRVFQYTTARNRWRREIYKLSYIDELTGLYNRRAFVMLGEQQLSIARRAGKGVNLAFADLDALKFINDHFGHSEGDRVLSAVAKILETTFHRDSDVIARIGGDEFVVFWIANTPFSIDVLRARLKSTVDSYLTSEKPPYPLSLSVGICQYQAGFTKTLSDMLSESDQRMYDDKRLSRNKIA
jgi:two-component system cell cycle response regulator